MLTINKAINQMSKLRYINSPSWREGGRDLAACLLIFAVMAVFFFGALLLTGGDL